MKKVLLLIIVLAISISLKAQKYPINLFVESKPPKEYSPEQRELNNSIDFEIINKKEGIEIQKAVFKKDSELRIKKGKFTGIDNGEWGGKLQYIANGNSQITEIKKGNISFLFSLNNKNYFIEGLAHGSFNAGALYQLQKKGNKFTYTKICDFEDAPQAITVYKDQLLVASFRNFYLIKNLKKEVIFKNMFWNGLYPNSLIALNDNQVFMGMRGGYVKFDLVNRTYTFYRFVK